MVAEMASQQFSVTLSPSPSPSPSYSSLSGSSQKRKRSAQDAAATADEFVANSPNPFLQPHSNAHIKASTNLLNGGDPVGSLNQQQHPIIMPLSSLDSQHTLPENPGSSLEDEDDGENGGHHHVMSSDGVKNGPSYGRFEGANGGGDGDEEEDDDEEEGEANEEEGEHDEDGEDDEEDDDEEEEDTMQTFSAARLEAPPAHSVSRVKVEPSVDGARESGAQLPAVTPSPNLAGASGNSVDVKPSVADTIQTSGAYCSREENLKKEEDAGRLKFICLSNDGEDQHMIWLIGLKNIFARQLPNMPKEYIVRLVMDRSHKSMMIIKNNNVVGGITYRPYLSQRFGEIAFCAITADEQVKGYGTRLMNHLKQYARVSDGLTHFLTYADNNAVGYFTKQGFTKEIEMEKERWHGYIKDYDGGTLMECRIDPKLPYIDLPAMIRSQRQAIDEKIRELSNCHLVYQGLDLPKKEAGVLKRPLRIEDIPGLKEAGWVPDQPPHSRFRLINNPSDGPPSRQALHNFMRSLVKAVTEHADAWPFKEPVDAREVPDYYDIIKDPIDLKTISKRVESEQYYITLEMFASDMKRMFNNARTYNSPETIYYKCTNRLDSFFTNKFQAGAQLVSRSQHL